MTMKMNRILYVGILAMLFLGTIAIIVQTIPDKNQELIDAAYSGDIKEVKALIAAGADVNAKNNYGFTALMEAALMGHTEIAKALIAAGADVNAKSNRGETALMDAASMGHTEIVKILKAAGAKE